MENENLENVTVTEPEEIQETVVTEQKKGFFANLADQCKELVKNPKTILDKIKAVPMKLWIIIGGAAAALIVTLIVIGMLGNTYKTPINAAEKVLNSKSVNQIVKRAPAVLNGYGESEARTLLKIAKKTELYKDNADEIEDAFDKVIELLEENVGRNYKINLKVTDKDELDEKDLKAFRAELRKMTSELNYEIGNLDKEDIEDVADELDISKGKVRKAIRILEKFCDDCDDCKVTKGYKLTVEVKLTGKLLDEPTELEIPIEVYKVDGRWVPGVFSLANDLEDGLDNIGSLLGAMGDMGALDSYYPGF